MNRKKVRRLMAVHEAGHAAVARLLGVKVEYVVMFPTVVDSAAGAMTHSAAHAAVGKDVAVQIQGFEADTMIALAGLIAQGMAFPGTVKKWELTPPGELGSDMGNAFHAVVNILLLRRGEVLPGPGEQRAVEIPTAMVDEAVLMLKQLMAESRSLIEANWPAVERLAEALTSRDVLDQAQVDALIAGRPVDITWPAALLRNQAPIVQS
jgi:ATP-dependent Zn protease